MKRTWIPKSFDSWLKVGVFVLILIFAGSLFAYKINLTRADDLPRQIKIGQEVLNGNFDILYKNTFSYTEPDHKFYNHHWLSGVVFNLMHAATGWGGLSLMKIVVLVAAVALVFLTATKKADFWLVVILALPTLIMFKSRAGLRPEIFSYLFIAMYLYLLVDLDEHPGRKRVYWLIPLQLLWVNMHVFFSIGIMMTAGFWLEKVITYRKNLKQSPLVKKLTIILVALVLVSFLNPRGVAGVFYRYPGDGFPVPIQENSSLANFFAVYSTWEDVSLTLFRPAVAVLAFSFLLALRKSRKKPIFYFLAGTASAILGFLIVRGTALFAIVFLPAAAANFNDVFLVAKKWLFTKLSRGERTVVGSVAMVSLVLLLGLLVFPGWGELWKYRERGIGLAPWSEEPATFFQQEGLRGPIFNNADVGSYLIYALYPQEKVFVDNRFADAYSAEFFRDELLAMKANEENWKSGLQKYNFNTIFFYHYDATANARSFLVRRIHDPAWALVYADRLAVILVRNTPDHQKIISQFQITQENVEERLRHLTESDNPDDKIAAADLFYLIGRINLANAEYLDVVTHRPDRGKVWRVLGETALTYNTETDTVLGLMFLDKAISVGYKTSETYSLLGAAYVRLGQPEKAKEMLQRALRIEPGRADAQALLDALEASAQRR